MQPPARTSFLVLTREKIVRLLHFVKDFFRHTRSMFDVKSSN